MGTGLATFEVDEHQHQQEPKLRGSEQRVSSNLTDMVQYLVEGGLKDVPANFILPLEHRPSMTHAEKIPSNLQIPVIDMKNLRRNNVANMQKVISEVGKACEEWGFFQVINHGIPAAVMDAAMEMNRGFFALPIEEKEQYAMKTSSGIGYGRRFAVKDGARSDWLDRLGFWSATDEHKKADPLDVKRPKEFNETMDGYGKAVLQLSHTILELLSQHVGLSPNDMLERVGGKRAGVRTGMNYYPPCPQPDLVMGISSHADASVLTILQQGHVGGLEVWKEGVWLPVPPIPNAFVINIGDQMQMLSNEKYKSVVHRALAGSGRFSIANFFFPDWETIVHPAPGFCSDSNPPRYTPVKFSEYITEFMKGSLGGKRFIDNFKTSSSQDSGKEEDH